MAKARKKQKARPVDSTGRERLSVELRAPGSRTTITMTIAARSGSFEWKAARHQWTPSQEQAGRRARSVWEAQGLAGARSQNLDMDVAGIGGGTGVGPQEAAAYAVQSAIRLRRLLGDVPELRLRAFLLLDTTVTDLAAASGCTVRQMTAILKADLDEAARYFGYEPDGLDCGTVSAA